MDARRQAYLLISRCRIAFGILTTLSVSHVCAAPSAAPAELYRLCVGDSIKMDVFGESDVSAERRVDAHGNVNLPLIGGMQVNGLTLADAETRIRDRYISEEIYVAPQVSVSVVEYARKEISVLGQVATPGTQLLPSERTRIGIVELISAAGGFTRIAKSDAVRITRNRNGKDEVFTVDVEKLISGRGNEAGFMVEVGDIVFVPERVF